MHRNHRLVAVASRAALSFPLIVATACASTPPSPPRTPAVAAAAPEAARAQASTIDPALQAIADDELARALERTHADGVLVVLDPKTGEIVADAGRAHGAPADVAEETAFITGSTMKAFTLAAALDEGVVTPSDSFDCEQGAWTYAGKALHDHAAHGTLTVPEMLSVSTNIGFAKIFDRLGEPRFERWLHAFHLGEAPGDFGGDIAGDRWAAMRAAIGDLVRATPLQIAAGYAAIANGGVYVAPTKVRRAAAPAGEAIMRPETARTVMAMLEEAVNGKEATGARARVAGVRVAGKTGTATWQTAEGEMQYASFAGVVPADAPRFVVVAGVTAPGDELTGRQAAAPLFARFAARALAR